MRKKIEVIMLVLTGVWLAANIIAPLTERPGSVNFGDRGRVGTVDFADQTSSMNPFASLMYYLGDINCHQMARRSLFINGNQMPFCARDTGIFLGMFIASAIAFYTAIQPRLWWIFLGLIPMGIDGTVQLLTPYESTNPVRLATGILAGIVLTLVLIEMLRMLLESGPTCPTGWRTETPSRPREETEPRNVMEAPGNRSAP